MLTTAEVIIFSVSIPLIAPLVIYSFFTGLKPPESGLLAKYYQAEPYLLLFGNLFLLSLCVVGIGKLALHFGLIDAGAAGQVSFWINVPFLLMFLLFGGLLVKAALKVRRSSRKS